MIRRPPRSTLSSSSAASDVYKRQPGGLFGGLGDLHARGGIEHRLDDVVVAGAAADIAFELLAHRGLVELTAMTLHDIDRRHDHARRAEAALQSVIVAERRLHR